MRWDFVLFFASLVMIYVGDWALYIGVGGLVLSMAHGTLKRITDRKARRMAVTIGLVISGIGFLGLSAFALRPNWFGLAQEGGFQTAESDTTTIARLAGLGWAVRPTSDGISFEIAGRSLPPMEESAAFFRMLKRPFSLQLGQMNGIAGLHYLADAPNCTNIVISAGQFTDISELRGFTHLVSLTISQLPLNGSGTVDPAVLSSLTSLQDLRLGMTKIRNADFVAALPHLKVLNLGQTFVDDVSAVAGLASLETLDVRGTRVTDLLPIAQNKNLNDLTIDGMQVPGLSHLRSLANLKKLTIIDQRAIDLSRVGDLTNLETLTILGGTQQYDIAPLQRLAKLRQLMISALGFGTQAPVKDAQVIGDLTELRTLTLGSLLIADVTFIENLKNLTELNLRELPIFSVEPLRKLKLLKKMALTGLMVFDISPLLDLPALADLTVGRTPVRADVLAVLEQRGVKVSSF
ncbi:MAG: hypothetical protein HYR63_27180 [Proteobacteria bacterium]|nr:hypothetical protein [Pseudomonadota bacterium]MBI3498318.1 hypothetical protein [Pseudomonadota bacterium]